MRAASCGFEAAVRRQYLVDRVHLYEQYLRAALGASKQQGEHRGETHAVTTIYKDSSARHKHNHSHHVYKHSLAIDDFVCA